MDFGFLTESDILTIQEKYPVVHSKIASTKLEFPYKMNKILSSSANITNLHRERQYRNPIYSNNLFMATVPTTTSDVNSRLFHILNKVQVSFWYWITKYVNNNSDKAMNPTMVEKMKIYQYYSTEVARILLTPGGVYLKKIPSTEYEGKFRYTAMGTIEDGEYKVEIDPLDILEYANAQRHHEDLDKILLMLDTGGDIGPPIPPPITRKRKITIRQKQDQVIRLVEWRIPIGGSIYQKPSVDIPEFRFVCFDNIHQSNQANFLTFAETDILQE